MNDIITPLWVLIAIVTKFKVLTLVLSNEALWGFAPCLLTQAPHLPPPLSPGLEPGYLLFSKREGPPGLAIPTTPPTATAAHPSSLGVGINPLGDLLWGMLG